MRRRRPRSGAVRTARDRRWPARDGRGVMSWMSVADSRAATAATVPGSGAAAGAGACPKRARCRSSRSPLPPRRVSTAGIGTRRGLLEWSIPDMTTTQTVPHPGRAVTASSAMSRAVSAGFPPALRTARKVDFSPSPTGSTYLPQQNGPIGRIVRSYIDSTTCRERVTGVAARAFRESAAGECDERHVPRAAHSGPLLISRRTDYRAAPRNGGNGSARWRTANWVWS